MPSPQPIISINQARFGYHRPTPVIEGITAELRPGRVTALVGPNAAGKSTLLRLMLGLLEPWSGAITIDGTPVHTLAPGPRARWLSYVPQQPSVRFAFTVREVVAMGAHAAAQRQPALVERAIQQAGLEPQAGRVFAELSGGQQQRVMLARAQVQLSGGGRAVLLDEPGSHLDLQHRHTTMRWLRELAGQGLAVLVVLHDLDLAGRYADDAWLIDRGRLLASGTWDQVLTPDQLSPVYGVDLIQVDSGGDRPLLAAAPTDRATMPVSTSESSSSD